MDTLTAVRFFRLTLGLVLIWMFFYLSIRPFLLDRLRQKLFAIRDDLFDFAADGGISFDNAAYQELRDDLNSLILFAGKISMMRALSASWLMRGTPEERRLKQEWWAWRSQVERLDPIARRKLFDSHERALRAITDYVIGRSLMLWMSVAVLKVLALWLKAARGLYAKLPDLVKPLEAQAREEHRLAA